MLAFYLLICAVTTDISNMNAMFVLVCPEHAPPMSELQEADEIIIGLPVSADGMETPQSNKVRSVVGRLAVQAAERFVLLVCTSKLGALCACCSTVSS